MVQRVTMWSMVTTCICVAWMTSCASKPEEQAYWPDLEEVGEMIEQPLASKGKKAKRPERLDSWVFVDPVAEHLGMEELEEGDTIARWLFTEISEMKSYRATKQARCLTHEIASYSLEHGYRPPKEFDALAAQHCGILGARSARAFHQEFKLSDIRERTDAELLELLEDGLSTFIDLDLDEDIFFEVGLALEQKGHRVVAVFSLIAHAYTIDPIPLADAERGSSIVIRGRPVDRQVGDPRMVITKGVSRFEKCRLNPVVEAPEFEFECPLNAHDDTFQFYLELRVLEGENKGRTFSTGDSQLWAKGEPLEGWNVSTSKHVKRAEFEALFLAKINEMRKNRGARPLQLAREQMEKADPLFERYAVLQDATDSGVRKRAARILRAICLGYWVGEDIQEFAWFSDYDIGLDPAAYVERRMASSSFRREILDPSMTHVAILMRDIGDRADVAVVTYAALRERYHTWRVNQVLGALNAERAEYGLEPIKWDRNLSARAEELDEKLAKGKMEEEDAFSGWYLSSAREYNYAVETNFYFDYDLREISGFGDLLRLKGSPSAGIFVARLRVEESPLFVHVVFISIPEAQYELMEPEELERVK